ncbi:hypothetical protein CCACVL1_05539 [Corchorus capsularis]|uniref:Uncharacterized protein n=1 Tax=Corchorus capsularis TaxID=210143 RepID=A0A1R3JJX1_COCAP|nr:hypothetical protein CCACVL1_05539 [Corchorus capsularis]
MADCSLSISSGPPSLNYPRLIAFASIPYLRLRLARAGLPSKDMGFWAHKKLFLAFYFRCETEDNN